jgi:hypothetical protein
VSLFGRFDVVDRGGDKTTLQNYSANWSPFPDSPFQFFFTFSETLRPEDNQKDRAIGPNLRWTISRHADLEFFYNISKNDKRQPP